MLYINDFLRLLFRYASSKQNRANYIYRPVFSIMKSIVILIGKANSSFYILYVFACIVLSSITIRVLSFLNMITS